MLYRKKPNTKFTLYTPVVTPRSSPCPYVPVSHCAYESSEVNIPDERKIWLRVLVALDVQSTSQRLGAAKEHSHLSRLVYRTNTFEDGVPVGSAKVCRCPQSGDGILLGVCIVNHNVGGIVGLDLGREVGVDLDQMANILRLDGQKKRPEPFETTKVTANPEEVNLVELGLLLRVV